MHREYWTIEGADVARLVGDRSGECGWEIPKAGISTPGVDEEWPLFGCVQSVVSDTMFIRRDEADDGLRVKTFGPARSMPVAGASAADWAVDAALMWLEDCYAVLADEVGWAYLSPAGPDRDDMDRLLLAIGESEGMPAVVIGRGGFGRAEFRPRISRVGEYMPLEAASARLKRWVGGDLETAVVPRYDEGHIRDMAEQLYFAHVGEIHADFRSGAGGAVRVWPMGWAGLLNEPDLGKAREAAAAQVKRFSERWAADNPGLTAPNVVGRVFAVDGGWSGSPDRSCYGLGMGEGWAVAADGGWGRWDDPFRLTEERERSSVREFQTI